MRMKTLCTDNTIAIKLGLLLHWMTVFGQCAASIFVLFSSGSELLSATSDTLDLSEKLALLRCNYDLDVDTTVSKSETPNNYNCNMT